MREEERKEDNKWRRMEMRRGKKERTEEEIGRGGRVRKEREKGDRRQDEEEKGGGRVRTEERRRRVRLVPYLWNRPARSSLSAYRNIFKA